MVGGFGASEYLFQQIKLQIPPQYQSKVVRPMDSVAAIVRGAVTAGVTESMITHRVARRHYLMATLQPFREGYHPERYRIPSLDGTDRCKYTRHVFVQKGTRMKIGEPVRIPFFRQVAPGATLMFEDIIYACDDDICPDYITDPSKPSAWLPCAIPHRGLLTCLIYRNQTSRNTNIRPITQKSRNRFRTFRNSKWSFLSSSF